MSRATPLVGLGAAVLALAGTAACGSSATDQAGSRYGHAERAGITLTDGWATQAPAAPRSSGGATDMGSTMSSVSGAYFTLHNDGDADALVGVSTTAARQAQLHTTETTGAGTSGTMKRVSRVPLPAGGTARLRVGGYHVMLVSPTRSLDVGDEVPLRLRFASGTTLDVRLPVLDREDRPR